MKLVDESGFLLGVFSLVDRLTHILETRGDVSCATDQPPIDFRKATMEPIDPKDSIATYKVWYLRPYEGKPPGSDQYTMHGILLEEWEAQRAVTFAPSVAYVKKLISDFPR